MTDYRPDTLLQPSPPVRPAAAVRPATSTIGWDDCVYAARQWWWAALPAGALLALLAVAGAWMLIPPKYEAAAWLQIEEQRPFIIYPSSSNEAKLFVQTQIELIKSPVILEEVLSEGEVAKLPEVRAAAAAPYDWLSENLTVKPVGRSNLFQIAFRSRNPKHAAIIANAIVHAYETEMEDDAIDQAAALINVLEEEKKNRADAVQAMRQTVSELSAPLAGKRASLGLAAAPDGTAQTTLARLQNQLTDSVVQRAVYEAELKTYKQLLEEKSIELPEHTLERELDNHPEIRQLQNLLNHTQSEWMAYKQRHAKGDLAPGAVAMQKDVAEFEKQIAQARERLRPILASDMRAAVLADKAEAIERLEYQISSHKLLEPLLEERLTRQLTEISNVGEESLQLEIARAELERAETVHRKISDRIEVLSTEQVAPARVNVRRYASAPERPVSAPYSKLAAAGLAFFCLPFGLAILVERRVRRIAEPQQISRETNLDVVGEITTLPTRSLLPGRKAANRFARHCSTFEESVENLGTHLMLCEELRQLQVVVVASAVSREGKSSLASQLAVSLANCSREITLLIDADLRAPDLHDRFHIDQFPGLVEVLDNRATLDEAIVTTWSSRLHLLPAGRLNQNAQSLLSRGGLKGLVEQLRHRYRYIVIDAPPVLAASEALFIARAGDGTLLCTMRDVSRGPQIRLACERLAAAGAKPLGAVLSGVPPKTYARKYGGSDYYKRHYVLANGRLQPPGATPSTDDASESSR